MQRAAGIRKDIIIIDKDGIPCIPLEAPFIRVGPPIPSDKHKPRNYCELQRQKEIMFMNDILDEIDEFFNNEYD